MVSWVSYLALIERQTLNNNSFSLKRLTKAFENILSDYLNKENYELAEIIRKMVKVKADERMSAADLVIQIDILKKKLDFTEKENELKDDIS